ncbi:hypothetical protein IV203_028370 [Nitzschia inconspicua]|uniref:Uncharacterized protein n=1 Tax=Nitzschia inconspicua TaxID=303405 RepID=A0A9K3LPH5_9STRA|nr:hypothetical protein IV203_028370 [Nitzschia inconspicua]
MSPFLWLYFFQRVEGEVLENIPIFTTGGDILQFLLSHPFNSSRHAVLGKNQLRCDLLRCPTSGILYWDVHIGLALGQKKLTKTGYKTTILSGDALASHCKHAFLYATVRFVKQQKKVLAVIRKKVFAVGLDIGRILRDPSNHITSID